MTYPWSVWRAFESERIRDNRPLWRALFYACCDASGKCNLVEFERWLDVFVWYPRGEA